MDLLARVRDEIAFEGNVRKSYVYRFLMNFQLWWPIWVVYLLKERETPEGYPRRAGMPAKRPL